MTNEVRRFLERLVPTLFENVPSVLQYLEKRGRTEEGAENKTLLRQWLSTYYNGLTIPLLSFLRKEAHQFIMWYSGLKLFLDCDHLFLALKACKFC